MVAWRHTSLSCNPEHIYKPLAPLAQQQHVISQILAKVTLRDTSTII